MDLVGGEIVLGLTAGYFVDAYWRGRAGEGKVRVRFRLEVVGFGGGGERTRNYGQCSAAAQAKVGVGCSSTVTRPWKGYARREEGWALASKERRVGDRRCGCSWQRQRQKKEGRRVRFVCLRLEHLADEVLVFSQLFAPLTPRSFTYAYAYPYHRILGGGMRLTRWG